MRTKSENDRAKLHVLTQHGSTYTFNDVVMFQENESVIRFSYKAQSDGLLKHGKFYVRQIVGYTTTIVNALLILFLAGCGYIPYQPTTIQEWKTMIETTGASGCTYARIRSLQYVDASFLSVNTYGKDAPQWDVCLKGIPDAQRALKGEQQ